MWLFLTHSRWENWFKLQEFHRLLLFNSFFKKKPKILDIFHHYKTGKFQIPLECFDWRIFKEKNLNFNQIPTFKIWEIPSSPEGFLGFFALIRFSSKKFFKFQPILVTLKAENPSRLPNVTNWSLAFIHFKEKKGNFGQSLRLWGKDSIKPLALPWNVQFWFWFKEKNGNKFRFSPFFPWENEN